MPNRTEDDLISVREAAKVCGRNMETIRRWIWGGKLPAEKLGNQLFIKRGDLTGYCREKAVRQYETEPKPDFLERAIRFQNKLRARGYPEANTADLVRKSREGRMRELQKSLR